MVSGRREFVVHLLYARMEKTALITGAARRIGAEITQRLHAEGYRVAVHFNHSREEAENLAAQLNKLRDDSAITVQGDLSLATTAPRIVATLRDRFGRLDVLVNNASIYEPTAIDTVDVEQWERVMATNLRAPYLLSTESIPLLRASKGVIINLTDIYGVRPQLGHAIYCVSKTGLIGLTRAMARDLAPDIRVNAVSPGPIIWAVSDKPEYREAVLKKTPLGRAGDRSDIAGAVCYLTSAVYVTGQVLEVDGGRSVVI